MITKIQMHSCCINQYISCNVYF